MENKKTAFEQFIDGLPNRKPQKFQLHNDREKVKQYFVREFTSVLEHEGVKFQWREYYENVIDWLHDNDGRGLAIIGAKGTGKSIIIEHVIPILFFKAYNLALRTKSSNDFSTFNGEDIKQYLNRKIFCIDEVGREAIINMYGINFDPIPMILQEVERRKAMLIMASNLTATKIMDRYGHHIWDRIKGNCKAIEFRDESFRK